ncbi:MAG TPA: DUF1549 domain-containing protein [Pirellulaceae bacterium]|nr:DUF1549 domain-containing protein [Pirellulaceae bacterium]
MSAAIFCYALLSAGAATEIDFDTDVLPILSKAGCNSGACHGAAAGRGGFNLSLFGGNPAADYDAIVRELEGRRINRADPSASLILAKPTGMLDHGGDVRLEDDGPQAKLIADWIAAGAPRKQLRELVSIEVSPANLPLAHVPDDFQLQVTARFSDGSERNVTATAIFWPADEGSVKVDERGRVEVLRAGRQHVLVRYLSQIRVVTITVPLTDTPLGLTTLPRQNWIDDEINQTLVELGMAPLPRAGDAALLRRVTLDLAGRLPTPEELRAYLADAREDKYERLVKRLIVSDDFADYWTYLLGKRFGLGSPTCDVEGTRAFQKWLRVRIRRETPLSVLAYELITAEGDAHQKGGANYHRNRADAGAEASLVAANFMGVQLACAECHNHPLDRWTQDDFHGLAAIFGYLERGEVVREKWTSSVIHPRTGEPAQARLPGKRHLQWYEQKREELAFWLTEKDNPYFSRAQVNWIWKQLFGRGIVEPADDLRDTNPATHPALLQELAADFLQNDCDMRTTIEQIVMSEAYCRGASTPQSHPAATTFYAAYPWRPLSPEVLTDAIGDATDSRTLGQLRAILELDSPVVGRGGIPGMAQRAEDDLASVLGRCRPQNGCQVGSTEGNQLDQLATQLTLLSGRALVDRISANGTWLPTVLEQKIESGQIVAEMYVRALSREPTDGEAAHWEQELKKVPSEQRAILEDLFWSLLTSREFATNH